MIADEGPRKIVGTVATVVIVDDDNDTVQMLHDVLDLVGGTGVGAGPHTVVAVASSIKPDAFLIDLTLPNISGITVARELTDAGFTAPMVGMSGSPFLAEVARESGLFAHVIEKPFDLDDLLIRLSDAVASARSAPS